MPWSKSYIPKELAEQKVMEFTPLQIDLGTPQVALEYLQRKPGSDFRMNEHIQVQTGVDRLELKSAEEKVEKMVLERLSQVQTSAYQEAYDLGMEDGRNKAFAEVSEVISQKVAELETVLKSIQDMKSDIVASNEAHIVKLVYEMASRLALQTLESKPEAVVELIRQAVEAAQQEENIRVQLHPEQLEFIDQLRKQSGRNFEFLKRIKMEPNETLQKGGCIVETNYGEIDSRVETRVSKLWESVFEAMPKSKDHITG